MVAAMWEAARSGQGQVVDAAIVDGALNLMAYVYGNLHGGTWATERGSPTWSTGATGATPSTVPATGGSSRSAVLQPKFLRAFLAKAGVDLPAAWATPTTAANWPAYRALDGRRHRHPRPATSGSTSSTGTTTASSPCSTCSRRRPIPTTRPAQAFVDVDGTRQPAPAPRFSRTPSEVARRSPYPGEGGADACASGASAPTRLARFQ